MPLKVLVLDDDPSASTSLHRELARKGFRVLGAPGESTPGTAPVAGPPDAVVLNLSTGETTGARVATLLGSRPELEGVPVLVVASRARGEIAPAGAGRLPTQADSGTLVAELFRTVAAGPQGGRGVPGGPGDERAPRGSREAVLLALVSASVLVDARDPETRGHLERVTSLGLALAGEAASELSADPGFVAGMLLHDVGKVALPRSVFRRPGPLTLEEWYLVRTHPSEGADLLCPLPFLRPAITVVRWHHERWDGGGYPDKLAGQAIPLAARVFALCDTYDSMTSPRPHRAPLTREEACLEIRKGAGTHFDPDLAEAFLDLEPGIERLPEPEGTAGELDALLGRLTPRRWQILCLEAAGVGVEESAHLLGISPSVVRNYRVSLRRRLELDPRTSFPRALRERLQPLVSSGAPGLAALLDRAGSREGP